MSDSPQQTLKNQVDYYLDYFKKQGKTYSKEKIEEAIKYLTYRDADELPKEESEKYPVMYVFRHGQSEDNANFVFSGWRDSPITEVGKKQAEILAEKLKDKKIHMLISSPQIRAIETMKIAVSKNKMTKDLEILTDERIKERNYGCLQGKSKIEMQMDNPEQLLEIRRSFTSKLENGESVEEVCERVADFCNEILPLMKENHINVAVSCHGNSIRGFRRYFENLSDYDTAHVETMLGQDYAAYVIR